MYRVSEVRLTRNQDIEQEGQTEVVGEKKAAYQRLLLMALDFKRW